MAAQSGLIKVKSEVNASDGSVFRWGFLFRAPSGVVLPYQGVEGWCVGKTKYGEPKLTIHYFDNKTWVLCGQEDIDAFLEMIVVKED